MNFGIFIEDIGEGRVSGPAYRALNAAMDNPNISDVSLFYQDIGPCPEGRRFGIFSSTDIAHFSGNLLVTFLDGLKCLSNEINRRNVYFYYGFGKKDLFGHLEQLKDKGVSVLARDEDVDYVKRKLCRSDVITCNSLEDAVEIINGKN